MQSLRIFVLLLLPVALHAGKIDSLRNALRSAQQDTARVNTLAALSQEYFKLNDDSIFSLASRALALSKKAGYERGYALAWNCFSVYYRNKSENWKALQYADSAERTARRVGDSLLLSNIYNSKAVVYKERGEYAKALNTYLLAIDICEDARDSFSLARLYQNAGNVYRNLKEPHKARELLDHALRIRMRQGDSSLIAQVYINYGTVFRELKQNDSAEIIYMKALGILRRHGNHREVGIVLNNVGNLYADRKLYPEAMEYYRQAVVIRKKLGDRSGLATTYNNMCGTLLDMGDPKAALAYLDTCIPIAESTEQKPLMIECYKNYAKVSVQLKDFESAYNYYVRFKTLEDSVFSEKSTRHINELSAQYQTEQQANRILAQQAVIEGQQQFNVFMGVVAVLVLVLLLFLYGNYRNKKKINTELERKNDTLALQNAIIEEKNRNITHSITYARRIQEAMMPSEEEVRSLFPHSFVLFRPRDIVSGDFYFIERLHTKSGESLIAFAAADCTGHGVPGAFMSIIGHDILRLSLAQREVNSPGEALDYLNHHLSLALRQQNRGEQVRSGAHSGTVVQDGMDIAFCVLNPHTNELFFSGAHNPCWIVRADGRFEELAADKQPVGFFEQQQPFATRKTNVQPGDCIYLFSDGYADQFGGEKGKKFKYSALRELFLRIHRLPVREQKKELERVFEEWKGDLEQVDDVLVFGVRIEG